MILGTAFRDFDIINLTYSKNGVSYVFDVDADPITILPGLYPFGNGNAGKSSVIDYLKLFLGVVFAVFALVVVFKVAKFLRKIKEKAEYSKKKSHLKKRE